MGDFAAALEAIRDVEGWLTDEQARCLWDRAKGLRGPARIVEIGSYRGRSAIVLGRAAADGVEVVAIDPHAGNDRGPRQTGWGPAEAGQADHEAFLDNLRRAGVAERVRHVRAFSPGPAALDAVDGDIDLVFIDGAHGYRAARDDVRRWGARVPPGGVMLIHDSFSSVGVTLALVRCRFGSLTWRYVGRTGSLTEYRREAVAGPRARLVNLGRQVASLPWFARNLAIKALIVARLGRLTRLLGHRQPTWPY
ncbi:MAG: class I SAM-dependent methyltransferase [Acidimicrobiales bacterium]